MTLDECIDLPNKIGEITKNKSILKDAERFSMRAQLLKANVILLESDADEFLEEIVQLFK